MEFKTSVEVTSELERRIRVQVPASFIDNAVDSRLRELARTLTIKGFRPGKAPQNVIRQRYAPEVRLQVIQEQLQRTCRTTVEEEGLEPAGPTDIQQEPTAPGDDLTFIATLEVYPTFVVDRIDSLAVAKPVVDVTDSDTDELIQRLRNQARSWQSVNRPAQPGDRITIAFRADVAGVVVDTASAKNFTLVLGEGQISDDAELKLTGLAPGMSTAVYATHSSLIPVDTLANQQARFEVTIIDIAEGSLPDIDADFCRRFGIASGEIAELRAAAAADMRRDADNHVREIIRARLARQLRESVPITLPRILCHKEQEKLAAQLQSAGAPDSLRMAAERNVHWALIVRQIFQQEKLRITREEINRKIASSGSADENQEQRQNWFYEHPEQLDEIEYAVMEDKVTEWLLKHATVTLAPMNFVELIAIRKTPPNVQAISQPF